MLVFFAWPKPAFAFLDVVELATNSVYKIFLAIITIAVDFVGGLLITFAGSIVSYLFSFQSFVEVPIVQIGWQISRDLANMVFILIMLLIAFGTVLRLEQYSVKKLIPKLVVAALLINFSLIICGAVIDFGNSLAKFFVSGGRPGESVDIAAGIMGAMRAGAIAQLRNNTAVEAVDGTVIMVSVGQLIMYIIIAFTLLALAGVMFSRIIQLWILIIFAPFAWVSSAVPGKGGYFGNWWSKFFNLAVIFPVSIGFFVFLAILTGATFGSTGFDSIANADDLGGFWSALLPETFFSTIMQFLVVVSLLWLGLDQAGKAGSAGGNMVVKWAGGAQKWALGKMKAAPKFLGGAAYRGANKTAGGRISRGLGTGIDWLEKKPLIGRAIGGPGARFQRQQKDLKDAEGKLKGLRQQDLRVILNQAAVTPEGQARRAAALSQLADKGQLKDEDRKHVKDFQAAGGNLNDIIKKRLDWTLDEQIQQMMAGDLNNTKMAGDWSKVTAEKEPAKRLAAVKKLIRGEYIPKKPGELADIQKDAIDAKESDGIKEKKKILRLNAERSIEQLDKQLDKQVEDIQKVIGDEKELIRVEKAKGAEADKKFITKRESIITEREATIENINDLRKESRNEYIGELDKLEQEEAEKLGRENQKIIRELILDEFKEEGRLYAASLNSLAGKNPGVYQELAINYLKYRAVGMKEELKKDVYRHLISGPMAAIAEETPPPATATPVTPPP